MTQSGQSGIPGGWSYRTAEEQRVRYELWEMEKQLRPDPAAATISNHDPLWLQKKTEADRLDAEGVRDGDQRLIMRAKALEAEAYELLRQQTMRDR